MKRLISIIPLIAVAAALLASAATATAPPPRPEPDPSAKGKRIVWDKRPYYYVVPDQTGRFLMRCRVRFRGPRTCWVIGVAQ
jgi:hypothetical protein